MSHGPQTVLWVCARGSLRLARPASHTSALSVPGAYLELGWGPHLPQSAPCQLGPVSSYPCQTCHLRAEKNISRSTPHTAPAPYLPTLIVLGALVHLPSPPRTAWALETGAPKVEVPRTGTLPVSHQGAPAPMLKSPGKQRPWSWAYYCAGGPPVALPASCAHQQAHPKGQRWESVLPMHSDL